MTILSTTVLATALGVAAAHEDAARPLHTQTVGSVGEFCRTGTVAMVCPNRNFAIEEGEGRRHFLFVEDRFSLAPGDIIAACGDRVRKDNGEMHEIVRRVQTIGHVAPQQPRAVTVSELIRRDYLYRKVTTEGTLVLVRRDEIDNDAVQMLVKDGTSVLNATFAPRKNDTASLPSLLGARIRMTGFMMPSTGMARQNITPYLAVEAKPDSLKVVRPPPADIFDAPELDLDSQATPDEIVHMDIRRFDGIVAATWGRDQLMLFGRDFHCVSATLADPGELPEVGRRVTAVGFPDTDLYGINLIYARCKTLPDTGSSSTGPEPIAASLRQLLTDQHGRPRINGYSHGRLLRLSGVVLDVQPSLALFSLNDDGLTMPVDYSSSPGAISRLEPGSKIEAVVLAVAETDGWRENIVLPQTRGLKLVLRSSDDLKVLARPPWWTPARLTAVVISLALLIVMIVVANRIVNRIMMRRKVSERTRLAVELHDSLSQTLTGVAMQLAAGHDAVDDDPGTAKSLLETAERMLESSRTELKNCLFDLRNDTVDDPDFPRAISRTLSGFRAEAHISLRFNAARSQMTDSTAHAVLCIIRELVANAVRHGAATHIWIAGVADGSSLRFSVRDDGCGFDPSCSPGPREGHFGLSGIHERLAAMKGCLSIESAPGKGTKASVTIV